MLHILTNVTASDLFALLRFSFPSPAGPIAHQRQQHRTQRNEQKGSQRVSPASTKPVKHRDHNSSSASAEQASDEIVGCGRCRGLLGVDIDRQDRRDLVDGENGPADEEEQDKRTCQVHLCVQQPAVHDDHCAAEVQ